jgi:hypothetical protein
MTKSYRMTTIALLSCSAFMLTAVGDFSGFSDHGPNFVSSAYAKNGNGGGSSNGGGNGNAGGNGNGGGKGSAGGNGKSASAGSNGKSKGFGFASASTRSGSKTGNSNKGIRGFFNDVFGKGSKKTGSASARSKASSKHIQSAKLKDLASLPVPSARAKALGKKEDKNFHAKLAGLNSLNRNFHAYLNAQDPRMAAIRDYVMANVAYENLAEDLSAAQAVLDDAIAAFATDPEVAGLLGTIDPVELGGVAFDYTGISYADLADRRAALQEAYDAAVAAGDDATATSIGSELGVIDAALGTQAGTDVTTAEATVDPLQGQLDTLSGQITDEALTEALLAAANDNRVAEYGTEDYVDQDMLDWAKNLLGVDEAYGKIDEISAYMDTQTEADTTTTPTTTNTDPS